MSEWRPIPDLPGYEASSDGQIRCDGELLPQTNRKGYRAVYLRLTKHSAGVHRLVATAFHGPCPDGKQCAHWDGDPSNNRPENLRWATPAENCDDKRRHGRIPDGERHYRAKLTVRDVRAIRLAVAKGMRIRDVPRKLGLDVTDGAIDDILSGRRWRGIR